MNAGRVQINFGEATPVAPVALHVKTSTGARQADIKVMNLGPKHGETGSGEMPGEIVRPGLSLAAKEPSFRHAHSIRWGINE